MAECACASLIVTSFIDISSLVCLDPTNLNLNWSSFSSVSPFIHMLADVLWLDAVADNFTFVGADFHAVTSRSFIQSVTQQLMSSAKRSSSDGRRGVKAFSIIFSRNILNSTGDNEHLCRTPTVVTKKSPTLPFSNTVLVTSTYNDLMISISQLSMLYSFKTRQRSSCQTRSNTFLKLMKV